MNVVTNITKVVSIIVPIYNVEKYLPKCIESILGQSYSDIEVILVDDGSTDRCGVICDEHATRDNRIRVVHQPNLGRNEARKNGFLVSKGEWIMFVDADDTITPNAVELLVHNSKGMDLISGQQKIFRVGSSELAPSPPNIMEVGEYTGKEFLLQIFSGKRDKSLYRQIIRREILSEELLSLPRDIVFSEDTIISLCIGAKIKKCKGIADTVYIYNLYSNNTVSTFQITAQYIDLRYSVLAERYNQYVTYDLSKELYYYYCSLIATYIAIPGINHTRLLAHVRKDASKWHLSTRQRWVLFITRFSSPRVRKELYNAYGKLAGFIVKFNKLLNSR